MLNVWPGLCVDGAQGIGNAAGTVIADGDERNFQNKLSKGALPESDTDIIGFW